MINNQTIYLGLIGNPLGHSLSPLLHNKTLQHMDMNCVYLPYEIAPGQVKEALIGVKGLGIRGLNVTIPYKELVMPYLDELSPEAAGCGSVNVIANRAGRLIGYNTDGQGFLRALREHHVTVGGRVVVIGCGGAARAVVYSMAAAGMEHVTLLDVNADKANALAEYVQSRTSCLAEADGFSQGGFDTAAGKARLVVNCTPVGMYPHGDASPVSSMTALQQDTVVCDVIYNPGQTRFLSLARQRGLTVVGGIDMFVHQAALTLEILLDAAPPLDFMKEVVWDALR